MGLISNLAALFRPPLPLPAPAAAPAAPMAAPAAAAQAWPQAADIQMLLENLGAHDPAIWAEAMLPAMREREINTPRRIGAFVATCMVESAGFSKLFEDLRYRPETLLRMWPSHFTPAQAYQWGQSGAHVADVQAIANAAYGNRMGNLSPGDGWAFRGRGIVQLTGRAEYRAAGAALGLPLEARPDLAVQPPVAARIAAWYWATHGCNAMADRGDIASWRAAVNGGENGLGEAEVIYQHAERAMQGHAA